MQNGNGEFSSFENKFCLEVRFIHNFLVVYMNHIHLFVALIVSEELVNKSSCFILR
jgi:hypothetical protein